MITTWETIKADFGFRQSMKKIVDRNWKILENADDEGIQNMNYYFSSKTFPDFWDIHINKELRKFLGEDQIKKIIKQERKEFEEVANNIELIKKCQEAFYVSICAMLTHPLVKMHYKGFEKLSLPENRLQEPHSIINSIGTKFITDNTYTPFIIPGTDKQIITDPDLAKIRVTDYFECIGAWYNTDSKPL